MTGLQIAIIGFSAMLGLMALRMPIGLSMLVVGGIGYSMLNGVGPFLAYMKTNTYHQFANYTLSVIPLFILMGALAERAGNCACLVQGRRARLRAGPRRARHGRDRRLHGLRGNLWFVGCDHRDLRAGCPARTPPLPL